MFFLGLSNCVAPVQGADVDIGEVGEVWDVFWIRAVPRGWVVRIIFGGVS